MKENIDYSSPLRNWATVTLNAGFAMTGFATVLVGCMLPAIASLWHADDNHAGRLLSAQFAGSAIGALLPGSDFRRSALHGYLSVMVVAGALALTGYLNAVTFVVQGVLFFWFGMGLGWAMTSTSLLVGTLFRSRRGSALSLLNASWTIGAAVCPFVATQWTRSYRPLSIFLPLSGTCILIYLLLRLSIWEDTEEKPSASQMSLNKIIWPLAVFALFAFLYVGVESSVSGWMMTYARRDALLLSRLWAPMAASSFWVAVLCGRLLAPALLLVVSEQNLFNGGIIVALAGLVLLIASHAPALIVIAAFVCGLALGPLFPLCISKCLELSGESPHTRYIFALSGLGGGVLPWMTGIVSTEAHSLRRGLGIPVFALCTMGFLGLVSGKHHQLLRKTSFASNINMQVPLGEDIHEDEPSKVSD